MRFSSLIRLLVCTPLVLSGIGLATDSALAQSPSVSPVDTTLANRPVATSLLQAYRDTANRFEIALPSSYTVAPTPTGVMFTSADGQFGGLVDVGAAQGRRFSLLELETTLKAQYEQRLRSVTWQGTYEHSQGGMRIDWMGQDSQGNRLDAISFIQQQGDTIFVLSMWGVNASYSTYNDDADAIFATYTIQP